MIKLISFRELGGKGIRYSRTQIWRKVKAGTFPKPIRIGEQRVAWVEDEVENWIVERMKERDSGQR